MELLYLGMEVAMDIGDHTNVWGLFNSEIVDWDVSKFDLMF